MALFSVALIIVSMLALCLWCGLICGSREDDKLFRDEWGQGE